MLQMRKMGCAHKFSSNKAISKILNIDIQIGRTGALTPVAKIKPVNIGVLGFPTQLYTMKMRSIEKTSE